MNDDIEAAANRAGMAARQAVKAGPRSATGFLPVILVAFAILSGIYLFLMEGNEPAPPTAPMPVPHVRAPSGDATTPPTPAPQQ